MAAYVPGIETLGFPKLAVIALLVRLLAPGRLHTWILWTMGGICCMSLTAMVMTLLLQCTPPRALWTFSLPHKCVHTSVLEGLAFWASSELAYFDTASLKTDPCGVISVLCVSRLLLSTISGHRTLEAADAKGKEAGSQLCSRYGRCVSFDTP